MFEQESRVDVGDCASASAWGNCINRASPLASDIPIRSSLQTRWGTWRGRRRSSESVSRWRWAIGVLALLCLSACSERRSFSQAEASKWVQQCGSRLIMDAAAFYASIPTDMPREHVLARAQSFLAAESSILTLALKEGTDGQPVGLELRVEFWNNIVAPEALKMQWRNETMLLVSQVLVATGIKVPGSWSAASAAPLRASLGNAFDTAISQHSTPPWTAQLRTLQHAFPSKQHFNWPPHTQ